MDLAVVLDRGGDRKLLLRETFAVDPPVRFAQRWIERAVKVPPLEKKAKVLLSCSGGDGRRSITLWGAPALVFPFSSRKPPDVVLVSIDTLRADRLGAYGGRHPEGISPFLDRIAAESTLFERVAAQAPFTLPSHVSMLSGQYPTVHGVLDITRRIDPRRTPLLASVLADAGYLTGGFTGGLLVKHDFGFDQGFDTYFEVDPLKDGHLERVLDWLEANRDLPFFLFFHTYAVHDYAWNDPEYTRRFNPGGVDGRTALVLSRARSFSEDPRKAVEYTAADKLCIDNLYAAGIRKTDDALKRVVEFLERMGVLDRTLLVVTADHGEELLDHGFIQHKDTLYEEVIHVPLLVHPPGGMAARRVPGLVELVDVTPTILDLVGLSLPESVQGRSLAPLIQGDPSASARPWPFSEVDFDSNRYALRDREWKIIYTPGHGPARGKDRGAWELYHLATDPGEKENRAARAPEFVEYRDLLLDLRNKLKTLADSMQGSVQGGPEIDPELMNALRAQGYVR